MRDADGRVRLVPVLSARTRRTERVDAKVCRVDVDARDFFQVGQDGHRARGRVNAPLRFRRRHTLHPMRTGLELEPRERAAPDDAADDFAVAAVLAMVLAQDLDAESFALRVARIHAE